MRNRKGGRYFNKSDKCFNWSIDVISNWNSIKMGNELITHFLTKSFNLWYM